MEVITKYSGIGGQAVMEGIMMRNRDKYAVAVRLNDGSIHIDKKNINDPGVLLKIPIIRGIYSFAMSLKLGIGTLMYSASFFEDEEEKVSEEKEKQAMYFTLFISFILAMGIFVALPYVISRLLGGIVHATWILNLVEGVVKFLLFLGYMVAISKLEDIKRVYMYHGAEHKCINCIESGLELTVENVKKSSRLHKRCGTSFLFLIIFISIIFHIFIVVDNHVLQVLIRLALIPAIAGVAYEFIRLAGRSENPIISLFSKPGLLLQHLTTIEPEDEMIEVGIASVEAVFDWRKFQGRPPKLNLLRTYNKANTILRRAGIEESNIDVQILMEYALGLEKGERQKNPKREVSSEEWNRLENLLDRRVKREPVAYIIGSSEFYGYTFKVNSNVLCPRPETEHVVENVLSIIEDGDSMLDICTGSGAIVLSVASEAKKQGLNLSAIGSDISEKAIEIAKENNDSLKLNVDFILSDMFNGIEKGKSFDIITANPPYIASEEIKGLMSDVKDYEPLSALDGGADGLDFYRIIAKNAGDYLKEDGSIVLEIGYDQGESVPRIFESEGYEVIKVEKDLSGNDRVVVVKKTNN